MPTAAAQRWYNDGIMPKKKSKTEQKKVTIRMPPEVHAAIVEIAKANRRSLNSEILVALQDYLARTLPPE
jgi:predicted HicB family RNase H-like nuclease